MHGAPFHFSDVFRWEPSYRERGALAHRGGCGRQGYAEEKIRQVRELFERDLSTSIIVAAMILNLF